MANILSIDASTVGCSVALFENDRLLSSEVLTEERTASEMLTTLIGSVLKKSNTLFNQIDAVAVAKGPGSYTGLRIAVSTAKGLCLALDKPLISFSALDSMVCQISEIKQFKDFLLCPMLDARRMEVYMAFYKSESKEMIGEIEAKIINNIEDVTELKDNKVLFFGEGSSKCREILNNENAFFLEEEIHPSAVYSGEIISKKYLSKEFEDLVAFEPYYLKEYMFKTKKSP